MRTLDGRWLLGLVLAAWSCAKANDSNLGVGSLDPNATGGTGATAAHGGAGGTFGTGGSTGGTFGTGGSSATGGKGGTSATGGSASSTGGSNSSGGSTSTGGSSSSTGGTTSTGGSASSTGGSGGTNANSGSGGAPDIADASVVLYYQAKNTDATTKQVFMRLFMKNNAATALDLSHVSVRYWMTAEVTPNPHSYYSASGMDLTGAPVYVDAGDNSYLEFTFGPNGQVPAHNTDLNATEFQGTIDPSNGGEFDQTNDWSFNPDLDTDPPQPNDKITVYVGGKLIWGCEPSGACPVNGEGGAGGEGGQAGQPGQGGEPGQGGAPGQGGTGQAGTGVVTSGQGGDTSAGGQAGVPTP
jgi:hypothetical protein